MATVAMSLLTMVAEDVLEPRLIRLLHEHGASGYTITDARGEGDRGLRQGAEGSNIRVEVIAPVDLAERILEDLRLRYFQSYAVVAWLSDIHVVRDEKFRPHHEA